MGFIERKHSLSVQFEYGAERLTTGPDLERFDGVLPNNEVHVWRADLPFDLNFATSLLPLLDPDEQGRAARFKVQAPRVQFVASHTFLRLALARYLQIEPAGVRYRIGANGKPELAGAENIRFNLSHTEGAAALVIARDLAVGIDVERIRDNVEILDLAARFFSSTEADWLRSQPASEQLGAFFSCWTAKEALLKAYGTGFSTSLADFTAIPKPGQGRVELDIHNDQLPRNWSIWQLDLGPDLRAAVAVVGVDVTIRCGNWQWPSWIP